jgi:hypothetical protein
MFYGVWIQHAVEGNLTLQVGQRKCIVRLHALFLHIKIGLILITMHMLVIRIRTPYSYNVIALTCLSGCPGISLHSQRCTDVAIDWNVHFCQKDWVYQRGTWFQQKCANDWKCLSCINITRNKRSLGLAVLRGQSSLEACSVCSHRTSYSAATHTVSVDIPPICTFPCLSLCHRATPVTLVDMFEEWEKAPSPIKLRAFHSARELCRLSDSRSRQNRADFCG